MAAQLKKPEHFWPLLWGAVCALLAAVLVLEVVFGGVDTGQGARVPARVVEAKLLPPFALPPEAQLGAETVSRPLFMPGRRPAPPAATAEAGVMKKGQFLLQGTTVVGDLAIAMLKEIATGKTHRVAKGGKLLDMTLSEVAPTHAVLTLGGDSETLPLLVAKGSGVPAAAAVPSGPFAAPGRTAAPAPTAAAPAPASPGSTAAGTPANRAQAARDAAAARAAALREAAGTANPAAKEATPSMSSNPTPEEILARRRAARRSQPQN